MKTRFVGRHLELQQLGQALAQREPSIVVIYGRRRIGKSVLIERALTHRRALFFEGLENQPKRAQIDNFLAQLREQAKVELGAERLKNWRDVFRLLTPLLTVSPACVVFDELQWMANYRQEIVSDLKMVWDRYWSRIPGVSLILCGSLASFMTTRVIKSSALYGRTDRTIHVKEFTLGPTAQLLKGAGLDEVVETRSILGGVPLYLELTRAAPSLHVAIDELAFRENGYFVEEFDRIFTSHFGRNPDYAKVVKVLAKHPNGLFRKELADRASLTLGGRLSEQLANLESAGFLSSFVPFDKPAGSRFIKFSLTDAYLRFYFSFIQPNLKKIRAGTTEGLFRRITQTGRYADFRGRAFELVCQAHAREISRFLGFHGVDFVAGPFFRPAGRGLSAVQIDLVFDRADNVMTLCEMKHSVAPIGRRVVAEVEKKVQALSSLFPKKTIQRVLVVHGDVSKDVLSSGYFYSVIRSADLL